MKRGTKIILLIVGILLAAAFILWGIILSLFSSRELLVDVPCGTSNHLRITGKAFNPDIITGTSDVELDITYKGKRIDTNRYPLLLSYRTSVNNHVQLLPLTDYYSNRWDETVAVVSTTASQISSLFNFYMTPTVFPETEFKEVIACVTQNRELIKNSLRNNDIENVVFGHNYPGILDENDVASITWGEIPNITDFICPDLRTYILTASKSPYFLPSKEHLTNSSLKISIYVDGEARIKAELPGGGNFGYDNPFEVMNVDGKEVLGIDKSLLRGLDQKSKADIGELISSCTSSTGKKLGELFPVTY
jgi:hypothetical protein